jgi:hypothetical protein
VHSAVDFYVDKFTTTCVVRVLEKWDTRLCHMSCHFKTTGGFNDTGWDYLNFITQGIIGQGVTEVTIEALGALPLAVPPSADTTRRKARYWTLPTD